MKYANFFAMIVVVLVVACARPAHAVVSPYEWSAIDLIYLRNEKVKQLKKSFSHLHDLSFQASRDAVVNDFFKINSRYKEYANPENVPEALKSNLEVLRNEFNNYYIEKYYAFYNVLFIGLDGTIFYIVRKESDSDSLSTQYTSVTTPLGKAISSIPRNEVFVDYHQYGPSSEPAAFFVEPIQTEQGLAGWIALQCSINKVNALFASTDDIGQTVETFLVNQDGYMLTESHFEGSSTILKRHLADKNIEAKYRKGEGYLDVTDYRGKEVLSVFQVVEFMGVRWLVVVKMDKDEVTSKEYMLHERFYAAKLAEQIQTMSCPPLRKSRPAGTKMALRVDMDEFSKASGGEKLETWGISSCTGLLIAYPKRFGYLAHISNKDVLYGGTETNLLGQIAKNIERFDISQIEKRNINFLVVAPHLDTLAPIVRKLIGEGYLLSQVYALSCPGATSAAITYDYKSNEYEIRWKGLHGLSQGVQGIEDAVNIGKIIEKIIAQQHGETRGPNS